MDVPRASATAAWTGTFGGIFVIFSHGAVSAVVFSTWCTHFWGRSLLLRHKHLRSRSVLPAAINFFASAARLN